MKARNAPALVLVLVSGLTGGLVGLFDVTLVSTLLGGESQLANPICSLVGLAAIHAVVLLKPVTEDYPVPSASGSR